MKKIIYILLILLTSELFSQIMTVKNGAVITLTPNAIMQVNNGLTIDSGAEISHSNTTQSNLYVSGHFVNNGTYSQNNYGILNFNNDLNDTISGTSTLNFQKLKVNKSDISKYLYLDKSIYVSDYVYLISDNIIDIDTNDLTLSESAWIYSDNGSNLTFNTGFSSDKCIVNSGSSPDPLKGGYLIKELPSSYSGDYIINFPISTPNVYSPLQITLNNSGVSIGANAYIKVKPVPQEHPKVSEPNLSLIKYWVVESNALTINTAGVDISGYYEESEVPQTDSNYTIGFYSPSYDDPSGFWSTNVGTVSNNVDFNNNYWLAEGVSAIDGDWTIGNGEVFRRIFYSRQNGIWTDANSWTFNPTHTGSIFGPGIWPNSTQDSVVIGGGDAVTTGHEIVLDQNVDVKGTALGIDTDNRGILNTNGFVIDGEYFTMGDYSYLKISSPDGITTVGNATGNIQTSSLRNFSELGIYEFNGSTNQNIGDAFPDSLESLIINNIGDSGTNDNNVFLDKDIIINSDLSILVGSFDLQTFSADKYSDSGDFIIDADAQLRLGGTYDMLDLVNNYSTYTIDIESIINFYGSDQTISHIPANIINGLGEVTVQNTGIKSVVTPLLIRGNLYISDDATLLNDVGVDALTVRKSIINSAAVNNFGVIEIGSN